MQMASLPFHQVGKLIILKQSQWNDSHRFSPEIIYQWCKSIKALGIHLSYNIEVSSEKKKITTRSQKKNYTRSWRSLSLFGKVSIIGSLNSPPFIKKNGRAVCLYESM